MSLRHQQEWCEPHTEGPESGCTCGLYAHFDIKLAKSASANPRNILAACVFWGRFQIHEYGFKAQYGRIVGLHDQKARTADTCGGWEYHLLACQEKYKIPVFKTEVELEEHALTKGVSYYEYKNIGI